jgi:hypothetical protein
MRWRRQAANTPSTPSETKATAPAMVAMEEVLRTVAVLFVWDVVVPVVTVAGVGVGTGGEGIGGGVDSMRKGGLPLGMRDGKT